MVQERLDGIYQRRYLFEGVPPQPEASRVTRVGVRDGRTSLWEVIHPDGSVTLNGIANFNRGIAPGTVVSGIPTGDGFIVLNAENVLPTVEELLQPGTQQVLFFSVADGRFDVDPETAPTDSQGIIESVRIYVKVGLNPPLLMTILDLAKMSELFGLYLPNSELPTVLTGRLDGEIEAPSISARLQLCTALAEDLFLFNVMISRRATGGSLVGSCCYTAIASLSGVTSEYLSPCATGIIGFLPGDPTGDVLWTGSLLPYADLLPTTESDRTGATVKASAYLGIEPDPGRWHRLNFNDDRQPIYIDPDDTAIDWRSFANVPVFLPVGSFVGGTQLPVTRAGQQVPPVSLSLPFSAWASLGVTDQQVWGLTTVFIPAVGDFGTSVSLGGIYGTPADYEDFRDAELIVSEDGLLQTTRALVVSDASYSGGESGLYDWTTQSYKIVAMPEVKAIVG